jgi:hypothetical protein
MFETGLDKTRNLLQISFSGHVDADEAKRCTDQVALLLTEVKQGFRLLTDMTGLESMEAACVPFIRSSMDMCNKQGVAVIARVIPDPHKDIGFSILSLFHYRHNLRIVTCETLEEAMKALENWGEY